MFQEQHKILYFISYIILVEFFDSPVLAHSKDSSKKSDKESNKNSRRKEKSEEDDDEYNFQKVKEMDSKIEDLYAQIRQLTYYIEQLNENDKVLNRNCLKLAGAINSTNIILADLENSIDA